MKKIDLSQIKEKSPNYDSFLEFRIDINWFVHNCIIEFKRKKEVCTQANSLLDYVDNDIISVKNCTECFENSYRFPEDSFVMPCQKPHLLIWVRGTIFPYWPAKAMSVVGNLVHVRFFQDHHILNVDPKDCYLFSEQYPENKTSTTNNFDTALKVIWKFYFFI